MLAAAPGVGYIAEPFNPLRPPGICAAPFKHWYTYVCDENEDSWIPYLDRTLTFSYDTRAELRSLNNPRNLVRFPRDGLPFVVNKIRGARPLMKDPIAFFSAEWLAAHYNMQVVILMRHPAAFAASLKTKNWTFPFSDLVSQPELMTAYLAPFREKVLGMTGQEVPIMEQAALLWTIFSAVTADFRSRHPDWIFLRHEDISQDPFGQFQTIFSALDLEFSNHAERAVRTHSEGRGRGPRSIRKANVVRESKSQIFKWKTLLSDHELRAIRTTVGDHIEPFYADIGW
jgi:hypothetical protein